MSKISVVCLQMIRLYNETMTEISVFCFTLYRFRCHPIFSTNTCSSLKNMQDYLQVVLKSINTIKPIEGFEKEVINKFMLKSMNISNFMNK